MARNQSTGALLYRFEGAYDFRDVAFSHGDGVVRGEFTGHVDDLGTMLHISGEADFEFSDAFADPLDIGIEAGGKPYAITGSWSGSFTAEVFKETTRSAYGFGGGR